MSVNKKIWETFNPRPVLDSTALNAACDLYAAETGDVNELALGGAVIAYLDAERSNRYAKEKTLIEARHEGDPAYTGTHDSPARLRAREEREREEDRYGL